MFKYPMVSSHNRMISRRYVQTMLHLYLLKFSLQNVIIFTLSLHLIYKSKIILLDVYSLITLIKTNEMPPISIFYLGHSKLA